MSDEDATRAHFHQMLEDLRQKTRPHVEAMIEGVRQAYTAAAELAGDPLNPENESFWQIAGNLFYWPEPLLDPAGPEVATLVSLSKAVAASAKYEDWSEARGICQRLCDQIGGADELGLSDDFFNVDWNDKVQRHTALLKGMQWHRVPRGFQLVCADVVTMLMLAKGPVAWTVDGSQIPQPWAQACTDVVFALAERIPKPSVH